MHTLADITPKDVESHIVNSLENSGDDVWEDEQGWQWLVRLGYDAVVVEITDNDGITTQFRLKAVED